MFTYKSQHSKTAENAKQKAKWESGEPDQSFYMLMLTRLKDSSDKRNTWWRRRRTGENAKGLKANRIWGLLYCACAEGKSAAVGWDRCGWVAGGRQLKAAWASCAVVKIENWQDGQDSWEPVAREPLGTRAGERKTMLGWWSCPGPCPVCRTNNLTTAVHQKLL